MPTSRTEPDPTATARPIRRRYGVPFPGRLTYTVLFTPATTLVAQLAKAHGKGRLDERLTHHAKPKLLIIDELGYLPFESDAAHLFFQLVSRRYERGAMLVTSNRAVGEWGTVFGDAVVATAILDRLLHHSHVITIRGDSFRLREKRRSNPQLPEKALAWGQFLTTQRDPFRMSLGIKLMCGHYQLAEQNGGEFAAVLVGGLGGFGVGPLAQGGLHEAFGPAIGFWRVGAGCLWPMPSRRSLDIAA